jgi:GNAT superfamily N-acetyltransferase
VSIVGPHPLTREHDVEAFQCGEPELDEWLQRHALAAQASDSARVFAAILPDRVTVVAFYAVTAAQVLPSAATARTMQGQPRNRPVPAVLLARFGVDERYQGQGLGRSLLQDAMIRSAAAADIIGARVILVHAKTERARDFYLRFGFEPSPTDPLHLLILMKDVRRAIRTLSQ